MRPAAHVVRRVGNPPCPRFRASVARKVLPLALVFCLPVPAQIQTLTFPSGIDRSQQPYAVYAPRVLPPGRKYPLVISLHAEHTTPAINLRQVLGLGPDPVPAMRDPEMIVACPLARGTMGYEGIAEQDVYDVLADAERRFPIDPDRVYLTGISMGGAGALRLALTRPDVWAAVALVCPTPAPDLEPLAGNALNLPVRIFAGDQDPIAPVAIARGWQRRFLDLGISADYLEYPGVEHNSWVLAYRHGAIFEWFAQFRRMHAPERVRFRTDSYSHRAAWWVRIDGLTPATPATVDARRSGSEISVAAANVDGFTLTLGQPARPAAPLRILIDGETLRARPAESLSFTKAAGHWHAGQFSPSGKRPGAEGPLSAAFNGRQIYVYGTAAASGPQDVAERRQVAAEAAAWSQPGEPLALSLPVKADQDVTDADLASSDAILFGTAETNRLIARLAPHLPLALDPGAADYGLVFVAPVEGRLVLINSGLPWWNGDPPASATPSFAPARLRLLRAFGDYVLFKGSLADVVAEGRFDRDWKLPAAARAKLEASGTVTVR
jgi:pimeloyl-ACP methyl ester carboxylesterase